MASKGFLFSRASSAATVSLVVFCGMMLIATSFVGQTYKVLHRFSGPPGDGGAPASGVVFDRAGNLYGTTQVAGSGGCNGSGCGTVYQLTPASDGSWTERVIYNFQGTDGEFVRAPVIVGSNGDLYGTTPQCTSGCNGTVYQLTPNGNGTWTKSILHNFIGTELGSDPTGGLLLGNDGNLYGTTSAGGPGSMGNVFRLSGSDFSTLTVLHGFTGFLHVQGDGPPIFETLASDAAGNLYGTTEGSLTPGTVFKLSLDPQTQQWRQTILYRFQNYLNGTDPSGGVAIDAAGNLYGTTFSSGPNGFGVVYKLTRNGDGTWSYAVIHGFTDSPDGSFPFAAPIVDSNGNVYGVTSFGGPDHQGTVFKLTPMQNGTYSETILHAFTGGSDGGQPQQGVLLRDARGNLYGTALGGTPDWGLVFEITP